MPLVPLLYIAFGFLGGYLVGKRSSATSLETAGRVQREASAVLESVGQLSSTGALASIGDLQLKHGDTRNGVQLLIKTHDWIAPRPWQ